MVARIERIGQIAIQVHDIQRATAFYRDVLGLQLLFEVPPKMSFFACGDVRLMLSLPEGAEFDHPASILYYKVDDITAAHEEMKSRGASFRDEPHKLVSMPDHDLWMTFLDDPEGNTLALMAEVRR